MTRYQATTHHHSISNAPSYDVGDALHTAKRRATLLLGDGFQDREILIHDTKTGNTVARRKISATRWEVRA